MSNLCTVEVRHSDDEVLVLAQDDYEKTFQSYEPEEFKKNFPTVTDLLREIADNWTEMHGCFYFNTDENKIVLETVSSLEVWGFSGDSSEMDANYIRSY